MRFQWITSDFLKQYETISEPQIKSLCDDNKLPKCTTDVVIPEVNYEMTGYYSCQYEGTTGNENSDSIYIYVNGMSVQFVSSFFSNCLLYY